MPATRRVSCTQLEEMVAFMEAHSMFARATQLGGPQGKQSSHILWDELASQLNLVGNGVTKTGKEWRQYWSDLKCKIKKKGSALKGHSKGTGGGPAWSGILSPIEERILSLIGVQNVMGNEAVRIAVDMGLEHCPPPVFVLDPPGTSVLSAAPTPATAEIELEPEPTCAPAPEPEPDPEPEPAPHQVPRKRKHTARTLESGDESPAGRLQTAPPRWALNLETRRVQEAELRRKLEERRLALDERRLALDERRFQAEQEWRERQLEEERVWRDKRLSLEQRRLALDERRFEAVKVWREAQLKEEGNA